MHLFSHVKAHLFMKFRYTISDKQNNRCNLKATEFKESKRYEFKIQKIFAKPIFSWKTRLCHGYFIKHTCMLQMFSVKYNILVALRDYISGSSSTCLNMYTFENPSSASNLSATNSIYCFIKTQFIPMRPTGKASVKNSWGKNRGRIKHKTEQ